jgi:hypothetical protein
MSSIRESARALSLLGGERVLACAVPEAETRVVGGRVATLYLVTLLTTRRGLAVLRTFEDVRALEGQLRALVPAAFEGETGAALSTAAAGLGSAVLDSRPRSVATLALRQGAVHAFLEAASCHSGTLGSLLCAYLLGQGTPVAEGEGGVGEGEGEEPSASALAAGLAGVFAVYVAGEGREEGAWVDPAPLPFHADDGARPGLYSSESEEGEPSSSPALPAPAVRTGPPPPPSLTPFTLPGLEAFDSLLEDGWAAWEEDGSKGEGESSLPADGRMFSAAWTMSEWDGSGVGCSPVECVAEATWALGDGRDKSLPRGLSRALVRHGHALARGRRLTVVLAPGQGYGEEGREGLVRPGSHLVYALTVLSAPTGEGRGMGRDHHTTTSASRGLIIPATDRPVTDEAVKALGASLVLRPRPPPPPPAGAPVPDTSAAAGEALVSPKPKTGTKLPSPADAEAAFRAYLAGGGGKGTALGEAEGGRSASPPAGVPRPNWYSSRSFFKRKE